MSRQAAVLILTLVFYPSSLCFARQPGSPEKRILFVGDILLSRQVAKELEHNPSKNPWENLRQLFKGADYLIGNLEGAVGKEQECVRPNKDNLCFAIDPQQIDLLKDAGFRAVSVENNHSGDLGEIGRKQTIDALHERGIAVLDYKSSPVFIRIDSLTLGIIPLSNVPGVDDYKIDIPSPDLRQKIRLARHLADVVIIYVHWGNELADWPSNDQSEKARWLITEGADLIVGHHPHVVVQPQCVEGKPVFYSLGNHLFDQKYPMTKKGLIADCRIDGTKLTCSGINTEAKPGSFYPQPEDENFDVKNTLNSCRPQIGRVQQSLPYDIRPWLNESFVSDRLVLEGIKDNKSYWKTKPTRLLSFEVGPLKKGDSENLIFTLENHYSKIDTEEGPRPYVYRVSPKGLVALWRGSALAWPLIDATLLCRENCYVCALHRGDSFLTLDRRSKETRAAVYEWNGFGFSGIEDPELNSQCKNYFKSSFQVKNDAQ